MNSTSGTLTIPGVHTTKDLGLRLKDHRNDPEKVFGCVASPSSAFYFTILEKHMGSDPKFQGVSNVLVERRTLYPIIAPRLFSDK